MIINALNAPVKAFMADFEDSLSPTWENIIRGQVNLADAIRRTISYEDPATGKHYRLAERTATLIVRPRGWHLPEKHVRIDGEAVSASLFDFALFIANNHEALASNGTGPYFYLPKLESHLEARLWNEVFVAAQEALGIARGTIKATVLIETILAAFEMDEILYELREHSAGLNCGRWDYIFSFIKKFRNRAGLRHCPTARRSTMDKHFLKSYVDLLIKTCHRRGAHAMGGMAAQIPITRRPGRQRGGDGARCAPTSCAKPTPATTAPGSRTRAWSRSPWRPSTRRCAAQPARRGARGRERHGGRPGAAARPDRSPRPACAVNIRVGVQYLEAWLRGNGCVPLYHLMEDAATAEICRAQMWQWLRHGARTERRAADHRRALRSADDGRARPHSRGSRCRAAHARACSRAAARCSSA